MSVVSSSVQFDYVELKIIDLMQPELSEMNIYMTPQQLTDHTSTFFRFSVAQSNKKSGCSSIYSTSDNCDDEMHREIRYSPSQIHKYIRSKQSPL